jgi:hypothetical protein
MVELNMGLTSTLKTSYFWSKGRIFFFLNLDTLELNVQLSHFNLKKISSVLYLFHKSL